MPLSIPPLMDRGAKASLLRPMIQAPMSFSGWTTRPMGLERRDSSPVRTERKGWVARRPARSLMVVPLLAASRTVALSCSLPSLPWTLAPSKPLAGSICTPRPVRQRRVASRSAPVDRPETVAVPWAIALRMRARWEMDLSPGRDRVPSRRRGRFTSCLKTRGLTGPSSCHRCYRRRRRRRRRRACW